MIQTPRKSANAEHSGAKIRVRFVRRSLGEALDCGRGGKARLSVCASDKSGLKLN